jgi:polysaccharide biosynthesis protein PslH
VRILFLTHRLPYAANRGDRIRALHLLQFLARHATVDLVSLVDGDEEASHAGDLSHLTASVRVARTSRLRGYARALAALPTTRTLTHALLDSATLDAAVREAVDANRPDVILAFCSGMARVALQPPLRGIPLILDMVDVDSEKWKRLGLTAKPPTRWIYAREGRCLAAFEATAARQSHAVLVVNERERSALLGIAPGTPVHVVPNGISLEHFAPPGPPSEEQRVVFCGVMSYAPNEEAVLWMAREVWPRVRARLPAATLSLVGSSPPAAIERLPSADRSIDVTGTVPDVRPHLWRAAVAVAPLLLARGVQNKVLEAVAAGLPCVVTPAVQDGLPSEVIAGTRLAATPDEFAAAIIDLLLRPASERRAIASQARLQPLAWSERLAPLVPLLDAALGESGRRRSALSHSTNRATPTLKGVDG